MPLSPGGVPKGASTAPPASDPRIPVILRMQRGAGWFLTIALLSGVNTLLQAFDAKIRFIFGLGITQVVDAIAHRSAQSGMIMMLVVDGLFIVMLVRWSSSCSAERSSCSFSTAFP